MNGRIVRVVVDKTELHRILRSDLALKVTFRRE